MAEPTAADATRQAVLARQPIVDARGRLHGYELLFRGYVGAPDASGAAPERMALETLVSLFMDIGTQTTLGGYTGYVNAPEQILVGDTLDVLDPARFVVEVLETARPTPAITARCRALRKRGFQVALDDYVLGDPRSEMLGEVDIVKVDLPLVADADLSRLVRELRRHRVTLLAEKVEKRAEYERCLELGFELFQGFFFARPEELTRPAASGAAVAILRVLQEFSANPDPAALAHALKPHPELTVRLLRLVNSSIVNPAEEIRGMEHAITFLGLASLRRWLLVLLFVAADDRGARNPLARAAVVRGRALELVAEGQGARGPAPDAAFLVGMLSLAEPLLALDPGELTVQLGLGKEIRCALLEGKGPLGAALAQLVYLERHRFEDAQAKAEGAGITLSELALLVGRADAWASEALTGLAG